MLKLADQAPGMIPVISYARISSDTRKDEHGIKDQHKINHRTAAKHGWTVVRELDDNDKSAAKADVYRDGFETMIKALRAGHLDDGTPVQGVVVVADDRLVRRPGDYERFVEAFTYHDGFVYADEKQTKNLYSEDVESMGLFGAVISKMEVRKMQRRMRNSHRERAEQGTPVGGPRPFGWQEDRRTLDPVEAPLLRQAARDVIGGRSLHSIVTEWIKNGVRTSRGHQWRTRTLKVALLNPRLCGWRSLNGELVRDDDGNPVVGQWEPVLTHEEWLAIKAIFDRRKGHEVLRDGTIGNPLPRDFRENRHLLTGILRCGKVLENGRMCNTPLGVRTRKDGGHHIYRCPAKSKGGCGSLARRGDLVDLYVSELVLAKLEEARMRKVPTSDVWPRQKELEEAQTALDEHVSAFMDKPRRISAEMFYRLLPALEREVQELRAEKSRFEGAARAQRARTEINVDDLRKRWYLPESEGGLPMSRKRTYVREVLHTVIVHPSGKTGRAPFNPDLLEPIPRDAA
ncbi:recombinase family protein [Thermoactinospora rubra]|uniref:recombinase family protein n=1 Tax=Thermoactinospora rubra TaxID=1088767 RepID=UPI000A11E0DC|nr:recombinase family protein [Thermoactinospora rubra]